jgi:hypothetical protein
MRISQAIESTLAPKVSHQKSVVAIEMLCNSKTIDPPILYTTKELMALPLPISPETLSYPILSVLHDVSPFNTLPFPACTHVLCPIWTDTTAAVSTVAFVPSTCSPRNGQTAVDDPRSFVFAQSRAASCRCADPDAQAACNFFQALEGGRGLTVGAQYTQKTERSDCCEQCETVW